MNINNNIKKTLITKEMLDERILEIAKKISIDYLGKNPVMICLLILSLVWIGKALEDVFNPSLRK